MGRIELLNGKSLLITGGTGSFGHRLVATVLDQWDLGRLIVFSRDDYKQHLMAQEFSEERHPCMRYFIGDVRDDRRLETAMRGVDFVIHCAALKQVPAAEYNPMECVRTNINGAANVVDAAIRCAVQKVIALSTDKACNPVNLYGATKLASDKIFVAANNLSGQSDTRFSLVRYGNVLGSRGSVIPYFSRLIDEGQTVLPITDPSMTRFWITLQHGVDFVLQCLKGMIGGEVFVPKLPSMKLTDMARTLLPGCEIKVIGVRPGEKLHEVMVTVDDARMTLEFDDHYVIEPTFQFWDRDAFRRSHSGRAVDAGFEYRSDLNTKWLTGSDLKEMMSGLGITVPAPDGCIASP